jgi:type IV secretion system protein TrbL
LTGGVAPTAFVALLSVLVLLAAAFTWLIMYGRKAAVLIICAFSPLLLAGQAGPQWARAGAPRAVKMLAAVIFAQPVAAVFYRLGVGLMALSPGLGNVVTGVIILLLVGFSPWLLLAFIGLTTQMLAGEQTRPRSGQGGAALTALGMAAATMRANSPARAAAGAASVGAASVGAAVPGPHRGVVAGTGAAAVDASVSPGSAGQARRGTAGAGLGGLAATGIMAAAAGQQVGAHLGDQVTTGGGATGDAPRGPQLAHAATLGSHRAAARALPPAPTPAGAGSAPTVPTGPAGAGGQSQGSLPPIPLPPTPTPSPQTPGTPGPNGPRPEPDPEPLAPAAQQGWVLPR